MKKTPDWNPKFDSVFEAHNEMKKDYMDLSPIGQYKRSKLTYEDIQCINYLMDFWETHHRETCKNEKVFKKFRRLRNR